MSGKRGLCGCRNHLGKPKIKYPSKESALDHIVRRHLKRSGGMPHSVYPCPRMDGWWHIKSERK